MRGGSGSCQFFFRHFRKYLLPFELDAGAKTSDAVQRKLSFSLCAVCLFSTHPKLNPEAREEKTSRQ
jgi:hypothetical protein